MKLNLSCYSIFEGEVRVGWEGGGEMEWLGKEEWLRRVGGKEWGGEMGKGECGGGGEREKGERGNPPRQAGFTILA